MVCEHCKRELLFRAKDGRLKMRVPAKLIALRKSDAGDYLAEMPCPPCRRDTRIPLKYTLKKKTQKGSLTGRRILAS